MHKVVKIFVILVAILGILSAVFLLTAKKKNAPAPAASKNTTSQAAQTDNPGLPAQKLPDVAAGSAPAAAKKPQVPQDRKKMVRDQWQQCTAKTLAASATLFWNVQITEGVPAGGTYAKGNLDNDGSFPIRVIIKSDTQIKDKISQMLTVGKMAFLRGNCTDVAPDGSAILQVF